MTGNRIGRDLRLVLGVINAPFLPEDYIDEEQP